MEHKMEVVKETFSLIVYKLSLEHRLFAKKDCDKALVTVLFACLALKFNYP